MKRIEFLALKGLQIFSLALCATILFAIGYAIAQMITGNVHPSSCMGI